MNQPPQNNTSLPNRPLDISRIKSLFSFDIKFLLDIIIGILAICILFASGFIFYFYFYIPLNGQVGPVQLSQPRIDQNLLEKAVQQSTLQEKVLNAPMDRDLPSLFE